MSRMTFFSGGRLFDGTRFIEGQGLLIDGGSVVGIADPATLHEDIRRIELAPDDLIVPGFVDLQVNGGGGVMLNDDQSVEGIRTICLAHARFGTTALLPTLITDTPETTARVFSAGAMAHHQNVPGFLGVHIEGPHLSVGRKGAHDPALIRPMTDADLTALRAARLTMPVLMTTIAPENVTTDQVRDLVASGVKISLGHTDSSFETARTFANAGASLVTHLFNAMSPLGHREPGLVGAALQFSGLHAGLICDGFHVDPETMAIALRAKQGLGHIFLVTDAMSTIGTDITEFTLNGRKILRHGGRLTLEDGTLAGADIDMISSVRTLHEKVGLGLDECLRMASLYPAEAIGMAGKIGRLANSYDASFAILDANLTVAETWIKGEPVFSIRQ